MKQRCITKPFFFHFSAKHFTLSNRMLLSRLCCECKMSEDGKRVKSFEQKHLRKQTTKLCHEMWSLRLRCWWHVGVTKGGGKAQLGLGSLDQEFLITDILELHRLLAGLRAVNHTKSAAGVAVTSAWPFSTPSSFLSSYLRPASPSFHIPQYVSEEKKVFFLKKRKL